MASMRRRNPRRRRLSSTRLRRGLSVRAGQTERELACEHKKLGKKRLEVFADIAEKEGPLQQLQA
eukprot:5632785-Amphidinium_carterae.1